MSKVGKEKKSETDLSPRQLISKKQGWEVEYKCPY